MNIDEAIAHCLEVAEQNEISAIVYKNCKEIKTNMYEKLTAEKAENDCRECATDHRQLAEWLTELKQWRRVYGVCPSYEMCISECKEGYNEQMSAYKKFLKTAVDDLNFESQCRNCKHRETGLDNVCRGCRGDRWEWRYADEIKELLK